MFFLSLICIPDTPYRSNQFSINATNPWGFPDKFRTFEIYIHTLFIVILHFFETISANELMQKRAIFWNERCWITINLPSDTIY